MSDIPPFISSLMNMRYCGAGTFLEIVSRADDSVVWCDPWINTSSYQVVKNGNQDVPRITARLSETGPLHHLLVSHTHGDHFADIPEIFYQCFAMDTPPYVWGDANAQSLICDYIARADPFLDKYSFYRGMRAFEARELTKDINPEDIEMRRTTGQLYDLARQSDPIPLLFLGTNDAGIKDRHLIAHPVLFHHSNVNPAFIGQAYDLAAKPDKRRKLCTNPGKTVIPIWSEENHIYGFLFEIHETEDYPATPRSFTPDTRLASFALISGTGFAVTPSDDILDSFNNMSFYYHIPQATGLIAAHHWGDIPSQKIHTGHVDTHDSEG